MKITGGVIESNVSANHGGGIYMDGAGDQTGWSDELGIIYREADDTFGAGSYLLLENGRISNNTAEQNGGGVYLAGYNEMSGKEVTGGVMDMTGGVITANHAKDQGGGVYLEKSGKGSVSAAFTMTDGAVYGNIAGDADNSSAADMDAGAEIYAEGGNTKLTVAEVSIMNAYLSDGDYVPSSDRNLWFMDWFDDYADADETYGKDNVGEAKDSGRYRTSLALDRIVYNPGSLDDAFRALILGRSTDLKLTKEVGGEYIPEGQAYGFRIELVKTPDTDAGTKYMVILEGDTENSAVQHTASGVPYITLPAEIRLKADESITVVGLPDGTEFKITETDDGFADSTRVTEQGCEDIKTDDAAKLASGTTKVYIKGVSDYDNLTEVVMKNIYNRPADPTKTETKTAGKDAVRFDTLVGEAGYGKDIEVYGTVKPGDEITYEITYKNYKTTEATVKIVDELDKNVEFVSASDNGEEQDGTVTWIISDLAPKAEGTVTLTVRVLESAENPGRVDNQAKVAVGVVNGTAADGNDIIAYDEEMYTNDEMNPVEKQTTPDEPTPPNVPDEPTSGEPQTPTKPHTPNKTSKTPKTGDESHVGLWVAVLTVSGVAAAAGVVLTKRKRNK